MSTEFTLLTELRTAFEVSAKEGQHMLVFFSWCEEADHTGIGFGNHQRSFPFAKFASCSLPSCQEAGGPRAREIPVTLT